MYNAYMYVMKKSVVNSFGENTKLLKDCLCSTKWLVCTESQVFRRFETLGKQYADIQVLDHTKFLVLCDEMELFLKTTSLMYLIGRSETVIKELIEIPKIYITLMNESIDWSDEVVVYSCGQEVSS